MTNILDTEIWKSNPQILRVWITLVLDSDPVGNWHGSSAWLAELSGVPEEELNDCLLALMTVDLIALVAVVHHGPKHPDGSLLTTISLMDTILDIDILDFKAARASLRPRAFTPAERQSRWRRRKSQAQKESS